MERGSIDGAADFPNAMRGCWSESFDGKAEIEEVGRGIVQESQSWQRASGFPVGYAGI
jgi:hypothetical protein